MAEIEKYQFKFCPLDVPINELPIKELEDFPELLKYCGKGLCVQDLLQYEKNIEEEIEKEKLVKEIRKMLDSLSGREKYILILRYGLDDEITRTLEEVGNKFGVTKERIRQIENMALRKLKHPNRIKLLKTL